MADLNRLRLVASVRCRDRISRRPDRHRINAGLYKKSRKSGQISRLKAYKGKIKSYIAKMESSCRVCGSQFKQKAAGRRAVVCGDVCRSEYGRQAMRQKYRAAKNIEPPPQQKACKNCGEMFSGVNVQRVYCTPTCSAAAAAEADKARKRSGLSLGSEISCKDCGGNAARTAGTVVRCTPCQAKWDAGKSRRLRERDGDRQRALDTAASARRRATEEGGEAYRRQCREWRARPKNRLRGRITAMMNRCLASGKQGRSWLDLVPYGIDELKAHIERQFTKGMTWENMGLWHIDHIVPVAAFNFTSPEDEEFKACFALTNLRPMWARENQRKSAKRIFLI